MKERKKKKEKKEKKEGNKLLSIHYKLVPFLYLKKKKKSKITKSFNPPTSFPSVRFPPFPP